MLKNLFSQMDIDSAKLDCDTCANTARFNPKRYEIGRQELNGNIILQPNNVYLWDINLPFGYTGINPGWDFVKINGSLTCNSTASFPAKLYAVPRNPCDNKIDFLTTWEPWHDYRFPILVASGGIIGFDSTKFIVIDSVFRLKNEVCDGRFVIEKQGDTLFLVFKSRPRRLGEKGCDGGPGSCGYPGGRGGDGGIAACGGNGGRGSDATSRFVAGDGGRGGNGGANSGCAGNGGSGGNGTNERAGGYGGSPGSGTSIGTTGSNGTKSGSGTASGSTSPHEPPDATKVSGLKNGAPCQRNNQSNEEVKKDNEDALKKMGCAASVVSCGNDHLSFVKDFADASTIKDFVKTAYDYKSTLINLPKETYNAIVANFSDNTVEKKQEIMRKIGGDVIKNGVSAAITDFGCQNQYKDCMNGGVVDDIFGCIEAVGSTVTSFYTDDARGVFVNGIGRSSICVSRLINAIPILGDATAWLGKRIANVFSCDPNDITGPKGFDSLRWVSINDRLPYTINFENDSTLATTAAQRVTIRQPLSINANSLSVQLGNFSFAGQNFIVPDSPASFTRRLRTTDSLGVDVDVTAGLDIVRNEVFWIFQAIDGSTGLPPSSPQRGLLPVNDRFGRGTGFVSYSILPKTTLRTGDSITAKASIVFDINPPIETNTWRNLVDAVAPTSRVKTLPLSTNDRNITIRFQGQDDAGGTGVRSYTLYVADNNVAFSLFQSDIRDTTVLFVGEPRHTYRFFAIATDNVGNVETLKTATEALIKVNCGNGSDSTLIAGFTSVSSGATVQFRNTSQAYNTVLWDFGDGTTSTELNPAHAYTRDSTYQVTLKITNNCDTNSIRRTVVITGLPRAAFTSDRQAGCAPLTVQFTSQISTNSTAVEWTFAGGVPSVSTQLSPNITYNSVGFYPVSLRAINDVGSHIEQKLNYISVSAKPSVNFNTLVSNRQVNFDNLTTGATQYAWNFGDNTANDTSRNPQHTYATTGQFTVTLVAINSCGSTTYTRIITVGTGAPLAAFAVDSFSFCAPKRVIFQNLSENATRFEWNFEGGTPATSTDRTPSVSYNSGGRFAVQLKAVNAAGEHITTRTNYLDVQAKPVATFANKAHPSNPLQLVFTPTATNGTTYLWTFGDGTTSTEKQPIHTYAQRGTYTVNLQISNECGANTASATAVRVSTTELPTATQPFNIDIFPNPNTGTFTLVLQGKTDASMRKGEVSIWNILNQKIFAETVEFDNQFSKYFNQKMAVGAYIVRYETNGKTVFSKMIVQ
jgi:PKD repeat protein